MIGTETSIYKKGDQAGFQHKHKPRMTQDNDTERAVILEEAFDSVSWQCWYRVLQKSAYHQLIKTNVKALYDNPAARLKINGQLNV